MISAILLEIDERHTYLSESVSTIYFGGGTPSILEADEIALILNKIYSLFKIEANPEVTLEANPEDLTQDKLSALKKVGINRLSIGIQTFSDKGLEWMNRVHSSNEAIDSFQKARAVGFNNISVDLIYAVTVHEKTQWAEDLQQVISMSPDHISLYGLTIEAKTVFGTRQKRGENLIMKEDDAARQYLDSIKRLSQAGYHQYEVSNFSKPGFESRHNSSYWAGAPYIGIGPGAHSYNGKSRQYNIRNNAKYISLLHEGGNYFEREELSDIQLMNEFVLTRLRTREGISFQEFQSKFELDFYSKFSEEIDRFKQDGLIKTSDQNVSLTSQGFLVADEVALQLFFDE